MTSLCHEFESWTAVYAILVQALSRVDSISLDQIIMLCCCKALSGAGGACGLVAIPGAV